LIFYDKYSGILLGNAFRRGGHSANWRLSRPAWQLSSLLISIPHGRLNGAASITNYTGICMNLKRVLLALAHFFLLSAHVEADFSGLKSSSERKYVDYVNISSTQ
jgi:hypothetical protein